MMTTTDGDVAALADALSAILRGESVAWPAIGRSSADFIAACLAEDLIVLVHERVALWPDCDWSPSVRDELVARAHAAVAEELRRQHELRAVLDALARAEVRPILLKGTPLAYSVYPSPAQRPRWAQTSSASISSVRRCTQSPLTLTVRRSDCPSGTLRLKR